VKWYQNAPSRRREEPVVDTLNTVGPGILYWSTEIEWHCSDGFGVARGQVEAAVLWEQVGEFATRRQGVVRQRAGAASRKCAGRTEWERAYPYNKVSFPGRNPTHKNRWTTTASAIIGWS